MSEPSGLYSAIIPNFALAIGKLRSDKWGYVTDAPHEVMRGEGLSVQPTRPRPTKLTEWPLSDPSNPVHHEQEKHLTHTASRPTIPPIAPCPATALHHRRLAPDAPDRATP